MVEVKGDLLYNKGLFQLLFNLTKLFYLIVAEFPSATILL